MKFSDDEQQCRRKITMHQTGIVGLTTNLQSTRNGAITRDHVHDDIYYSDDVRCHK